MEIEKFQAREYWTIHLDSHKGKQAFSARLVQYRGEKLDQFSIATGDAQQSVLDPLANAETGSVTRVEKETQITQRGRAVYDLHAATGGGTQARHDH